MSTDGTSSHVAKVGMRVPPFCHEDPALWFEQLEGQFGLPGITADTTKSHHVAAQLEYLISKEVKVITNPPADNRYQTHTAELIRRLSTSRVQERHRLLTHKELGNRRPSQFHRHHQSLSGADVPTEFLKAPRLPLNTQTLHHGCNRRAINDSLHGSSHPGAIASIQLITTRFVRPGVTSKQPPTPADDITVPQTPSTTVWS